MKQGVFLLPAVLLACAPSLPPAAAKAPPEKCQPAPQIHQTVGLAPHSTFVSEDEPPKRFAYSPNHVLKVAFGQANIDAICGRPPCDKIFLGCTRGDVIVLLDPFKADSLQFAKITRHEIAHVNGWPDTHGD